MTLTIRRNRLRHTGIAILLLAIALASCGDLTGVTTDDIAARRRWIATAPASYDVTVAHDCFCVFDVTRPVIVAVRNGQVERRRYVDTGAPVAAQFASAFPTVDELFAIIDDARRRNAFRVDVTYDAMRGFPVTADIDDAAGIADDESYYGMSDFVVR